MQDFMTELELHLLNDYQRDFPLVSMPFEKIAAQLHVSEREVMDGLQRLRKGGAVSRVGAVFRPNTIGVSTLVALAAPPEKLTEIARQVSAHPEVNHNYEREHRYNLWFVVTASDSGHLSETLQRIQEETGYPLLVLPMLEGYHIDLGFDLVHKVHGVPDRVRAEHAGDISAPPLNAPRARHPAETELVAAIQNGIPLVSRPYAEIGASAGISEQEVITCLAQLIEQGVIRRLGVVVRHHELGYRANAMVVWDVPDEQVGEIGQRLGQLDCVTLCYRRPRRLPGWRYNLFTMIHGHDRDEVAGLVAQMRQACNLSGISHEVLFSLRRFKQCGARYAEAAVV